MGESAEHEQKPGDASLVTVGLARQIGGEEFVYKLLNGRRRHIVVFPAGEAGQAAGSQSVGSARTRLDAEEEVPAAKRWRHE